jgi:hypothetical protein
MDINTSIQSLKIIEFKLQNMMSLDHNIKYKIHQQGWLHTLIHIFSILKQTVAEMS